jgi:hypothetical protein
MATELVGGSWVQFAAARLTATAAQRRQPGVNAGVLPICRPAGGGLVLRFIWTIHRYGPRRAARAGRALLFPLFYQVEIRHRQLLQWQSRTRLGRRCPVRYGAIMAIVWSLIPQAWAKRRGSYGLCSCVEEPIAFQRQSQVARPEAEGTPSAVATADG